MQIAQPTGIGSVDGLRARELLHHGGIDGRAGSLYAVGVRGSVVLEKVPSALHREFEAGEIGIGAHAIFVPMAVHVGEDGVRRSGGVELLRGGKLGTVFGIAAVAQMKSKMALRQQRQLMVLQVTIGVGQVLAASHRESRVEIIARPPGHVVAVKAVLLDAQHRRFIRIVAEPAGVEQNLIEVMTVAVLRLERETAAKQTQSVAEIRVAAIFADVAAHQAEAIAEFVGLHHVVIAPGVAARRTDLLGRGGHHLLCLQSAEKHESEKGRFQHGGYLRKYWSALDPCNRT